MIRYKLTGFATAILMGILIVNNVYLMNNLTNNMANSNYYYNMLFVLLISIVFIAVTVYYVLGIFLKEESNFDPLKKKDISFNKMASSDVLTERNMRFFINNLTTDKSVGESSFLYIRIKTSTN